MSARDEILRRVSRALGDDPPPPAPGRPAPSPPRPGDLELFVDRLVDYKAVVTRCAARELPDAVAGALDDAGPVVAPQDLPEAWLSRYTGTRTTDVGAAGAVITGCAAAIAETGTIILDAGVAQGPRALSLIPDHHVCVVRADQVWADVPDVITRLTPTAPLTWISGPSATSDIELNRVEGVHGPRRLHVLLVG